MKLYLHGPGGLPLSMKTAIAYAPEAPWPTATQSPGYAPISRSKRRRAAG